MHVLQDAESIDAEIRSCTDPCMKQLIADRAEFVRQEVDTSEGERASVRCQPPGVSDRDVPAEHGVPSERGSAGHVGAGRPGEPGLAHTGVELQVQAGAIGAAERQ